MHQHNQIFVFGATFEDFFISWVFVAVGDPVFEDKAPQTDCPQGKQGQFDSSVQSRQVVELFRVYKAG
jgi:hypothetical protein